MIPRKNKVEALLLINAILWIPLLSNIIPLITKTEKITVYAKTVIVEEKEKEEKQPKEKDLIEKYFEKEDQDIARKIQWLESRNYPDVINDNPATGDYSIGLFQINLIGKLFPGRLKRAEFLGYRGAKTRQALTQWLLNPENNVKYASSMQRTNGWEAWSTFKHLTNY